MKENAKIKKLNDARTKVTFPRYNDAFERFCSDLADVLRANYISFERVEYSSEDGKFFVYIKHPLHLPIGMIGDFEYDFPIDPQQDIQPQIQAIIDGIDQIKAWSQENYLKMEADKILKRQAKGK